MNILCFIGIHRFYFKDKFIPSISAEIVTEYKSYLECNLCGFKKQKTHLKWDSEKSEMIDV